MEKIWADCGIKMAVHYAESRGYRNKVYNWRMIKSRFGETQMIYYCGGTPRWSDKPEALAWAQGKFEGDVKEINDALRAGSLEMAKAAKEQQKAEGRW